MHLTTRIIAASLSKRRPQIWSVIFVVVIVSCGDTGPEVSDETIYHRCHQKMQDRIASLKEDVWYLSGATKVMPVRDRNDLYGIDIFYLSAFPDLDLYHEREVACVFNKHGSIERLFPYDLEKLNKKSWERRKVLSKRFRKEHGFE